MTTRIKSQMLSALSLLAVALFLGLLTGRPECFLVGAPLLAMLLWTASVPWPAPVSLACAVSEDRLVEGGVVQVTVTLTAATAIPQVEVFAPVPARAELAAGRNRAVFGLRAGQPQQWQFTIRCTGRARFALGEVHVRVWDRTGLLSQEMHRPADTPVRVYPSAVPLRRPPHPRQTQTASGNYVSPAFGEGLEPGEIRPFVPGDRIRHVNWRTSLRLGQLYVTQYRQERNADVVVMLDTLTQIGLPPNTSLDLSVRAAAALASAYLARKDRVGLIEYGGTLRWVRPAVGRLQYERLLDTLLTANTVFSYVTRDLTVVPPRILPPRALVIAISPLLDERFEKAVGDLAGRGFDVVLLALSPVEITRRVVSRTPLDDLACRLWALERQEQLAGLCRQGVEVLDWSPEAALETVLAPFARGRQRKVAVG